MYLIYFERMGVCHIYIYNTYMREFDISHVHTTIITYPERKTRTQSIQCCAL